MIRLAKDVNAMVKVAVAEGFHWDGKLTGGGHIKLRHSNGGIVVLPATPSCHAWRKNAESTIRRVARTR